MFNKNQNHTANRTDLIKLLSLLLLVLLFSCSAVQAASDPNRPIRDKWALIVGISNFKDPSMNLKYPAKDAKDFAKFLTEEANFAPDHVKLLIDEKATRENILDYIGDKWLPRVTSPDDLVLIYISSHGSPDELDVGGVNYVVAHDTHKTRLYSSGIAMQDLARIVKRVHSDRVLILLDACHSGAASVADQKGLVRTGNISAEDIAQGTGQLVICSSGTSEVSWESKRYQNSVFTHCLIDALRQNGKDTKLGSAFTSLKDTVETEVRRDRGAQQMPVLKGQWTGDELMVALPATHPGPGLEVEEEEIVSTAAGTTPSTTAVTAPPGSQSQGQTSAVFQTQTTIATIGGGTPSSDMKSTGASPAAATQPQPALIAVLPFAGPEEVKCKGGGLVSLMRSKGFKQPRESDFSSLPEALRQTLSDKLKEKFGDRIKGPKELSGSGAGAFYSQNIAAEYLLEGAIHQIELDSGDLFGNKYEIQFSADLLSGATRKRIFSISERTISGFLKGDTDPLAQIYTTVLGKISDIVTERTLSKIQPAPR